MKYNGWIISLVGSLFFFYAFLQVNMMTPLNHELLGYFKATSSEIALLSAWYFYANIIFLLPAGLILDRFSIRKIMLANIIIAICGALIFGLASTLFVAGIGRFLSGIMMAFGLITCLKLASLWLPSKNMALASSLIITIGMMGGIVAQTPLSVMVEKLGWRGAVCGVALLGVVVAAILFLFIKDPKREKEICRQTSVFKSLYRVIIERQNWCCGFFISLLNLPIAILGALFGVTYLTQAYGISPISAASITSMLFLGMIFGSPFFGWLSDYIKLRRIVMLIGGIWCLMLMLVALYLYNLNITILYILFLGVGFASGSQVLGYPVISESNPPEITGSALSLAAMIIMGGGYGLGLPLVGWLLDKSWQGEMIDGIHLYSSAAYHKAFLTIPIGIVISLVATMLMKETRCRSIVKKV